MRLTILFFLIVAAANAQIKYYVSPSGKDTNTGVTQSLPFATISKAAAVAKTGDEVYIMHGTYRETIVPTANGVTFRNGDDGKAIISGLNQITTAWTQHSGSIYKTSVTLPVNGFQHNLTSNTTILANQIFKDGSMMFQARWPKVNSTEDLIDRNKWRHHKQTTGGIGYTQLTDNGLPAGNFTGAAIWVTGWFISEARTGVQHSGKTLTYPVLRAQNGNKFQKWYYITNDLELLTQAKEWHYENNTLYFWQENGGAPTNVEYKARNWGFDLRGKDNTKIIGLYFIGCEPATGDAATDGTVIDGIRASYMNHAFLTTTGGDYNYFNAKQSGIKLLGSNNTVKNSEFKYSSGQVIWASNGTVVENNLCHDIGWEGNYGAFVTPWEGSNMNMKIQKNTAYRLGRSAVDFGHGTHQNIDIGYNHFYEFSMVTSDVGAIYGCCHVNITGTRIHHNWIHDNMVRDGWKDGANYDGIHTNIYFDQGAGPATVDHNVMWNGGVADIYSQIEGVLTKIYNNTFGTTNADYSGRESYFCPHLSPSDPQRNNIYRNVVNIVWNVCKDNNNGSQPGDVSNSIFNTTDPRFIGPLKTGLGYKLQTGSPAINAGMAISGITDGSVGLPDAGAYEFGAPDWIPGYVATSPPDPGPGPDPEPPIPPDTLDPEPPIPPVIVLKDTVYNVDVPRGYRAKGVNYHYADSVVTPDDLIEAESGKAAPSTGWQIQGGTVCCLQANAVLTYKSVVSPGKIKILYAKADDNVGNGVLTIEIGSWKKELQFEPTGGWKVWKTKTFDVPVGVSGELKFTVKQSGACDLDSFQLTK